MSASSILQLSFWLTAPSGIFGWLNVKVKGPFAGIAYVPGCSNFLQIPEMLEEISTRLGWVSQVITPLAWYYDLVFVAFYGTVTGSFAQTARASPVAYSILDSPYGPRQSL
jgi:hypothetical protein